MPKITITDIMQAKGQRPLTCLTAYTYNMAAYIEEAADLILVGDSLGMVIYGLPTTVPVTMDMMSLHGQAVCRGAPQSCVVVDMPFGSYEASKEKAFENAAKLMKDTNCSAVKLEGGTEMAETVFHLTKGGIPVMGHIGLKPQSVHADGGYRVHGKDSEEAKKLYDDGHALQEAGAFSVVAECVTPDLASGLMEKLNIPVIGIGSSWQCDGQIIVTEDLLGLTFGRIPSFVPQQAELGEDIKAGVEAFKNEIAANYKQALKEVA